MLKKTLRDNYEGIDIDQSDWKHGEPTEPRDGVDGVLIPVKNPYAHLVSYFRGWRKGHILKNHYRYNPDDVLTDVLDIMPEDRAEFQDSDIESNPRFLKTWCEKYTVYMDKYRYLKNQYPNYYFLEKHIMFIHHPVDVIETVQRLFDLEEKDSFMGYLIPGKEIGTEGKKKDNDFDESYYIDEKYMDDLKPEQKEILNQHLNWDTLENYYGFMKK